MELSVFGPDMDEEQQQTVALMTSVMSALVEAKPGVGFCLFMFDPDDPQPKANYFANTDRMQTLRAIRQWVTQQESA